jgi:hypothetical protein
MYENQEPQENQEVKPELTTEEKLAEAGLTELATTAVKPLADVLGLEVKFYGYLDNSWVTGGDKVTVRHELEHLHKNLKNLETEKQDWYSKWQDLSRKRSKLEDYLDENWDSIDEEVRDELCEIFGIEQEVTKTVNITITGSLEVTAPRGYDWDSIENDLEIDGSVRITNSDLDEASYGFDVSDTEVEVD